MKKRSLLFLVVCSLFQLDIAGKSSGVEKKHPHIVIRSIENHTSHDLLIADKNKNWDFVLESKYVINSSSIVVGTTGALHDQGCIEQIHFYVFASTDDLDLDFDDYLYVTVCLMDHTIDPETYKEGDRFLFFGISCPGKESHWYTKDIDAHGPDTIEIDLSLVDLAVYSQECPEIAKQYNFFGVFTDLNE